MTSDILLDSATGKYQKILQIEIEIKIGKQ